MKKKPQQKGPGAARPPKAALKPPRLSRLGTLAELTQGMGGLMTDGGSGMSRP